MTEDRAIGRCLIQRCYTSKSAFGEMNKREWLIPFRLPRDIWLTTSGSRMLRLDKYLPDIAKIHPQNPHPPAQVLINFSSIKIICFLM